MATRAQLREFASGIVRGERIRILKELEKMECPPAIFRTGAEDFAYARGLRDFSKKIKDKMK